MSETFRLAVLAGTLFATSYAGVAWVTAGTPVPAMSIPTASFPQLSLPQNLQIASLPSALPKLDIFKSQPSGPATPTPAVEKAPVQQIALPPRGDGNPQRDKLRIDALRASTAYVNVPCDEAAKTVMIRAVSSYAQAWADMMGCGPDGCDYKKINATAAAISTPLDIQVRDAIGTAFDKRGVAIDDFPSQLRINVAMLVRGRGAPATACPQTRAQILR
jgi:hypothetical protein